MNELEIDPEKTIEYATIAVMTLVIAKALRKAFKKRAW